jgi:hypothetical protein
MAPDKDRDRSLDHLLRQRAGSAPMAPAGADCVDGETLAAWSTGTLRSSESAAVETHLADCARCQAMLAAFARTNPAAAVATPWWQPWHLRWLVPLATAATVAAIWVAVPGDRPAQEPIRMGGGSEQAASTPRDAPAASASREAPTATAPREAPAANAPLAATPQARQDARAPAAAAKELMTRTEVGRQNERAAAKSQQKRTAAVEDRMVGGVTAGASGRVARDARSEAAAPPPPPAAPAPAPQVLAETALMSARSRNIEIVVPNSAQRWRITVEGRLERSMAGATWEPVELPASERLTAAHAPAPLVLWVVGRGGVIYVTLDGSRFTAVPFVERVDLVSVHAVDDRQATITAADGRAFRTTDRGATWQAH